jgi:uncharacterized protein
MRSSRNRFTVLVGVLIAICAVAVTAQVLRGPFLTQTVLAAPNAATVTTERDTLTVIGEGDVNAAPDTALVDLGVSPKRGTAGDALTAANTEITRLVAAIVAKGVDPSDVQTTSMSVSQTYGCCGNVSGYQASNGVRVVIHHLSNVALIISTAAQSAGDDIQLGGIAFEFRNNTDQVKAARQAAMGSASDRARQWAALAGRHIGKVLAVSEVVSGPPVSSCTSGCGGGGGPVNPGQVTTSVQVTVVYALAD